METCYSGLFGEKTRGIKGVLSLTATAGKEPSKACNFDIGLRVWMSNYFSENLFTGFSQKGKLTMYDLYRQVYKGTIGSHVSVYNADCFDNLYQSLMNEFLEPYNFKRMYMLKVL